MKKHFYEKKNLDPQIHVQQEIIMQLLLMKSIRTFLAKKCWQIRDAGIAQFTGEDDEVISLSPSYLWNLPSFDDGDSVTKGYRYFY